MAAPVLSPTPNNGACCGGRTTTEVRTGRESDSQGNAHGCGQGSVESRHGLEGTEESHFQA